MKEEKNKLSKENFKDTILGIKFDNRGDAELVCQIVTDDINLLLKKYGAISLVDIFNCILERIGLKCNDDFAYIARKYDVDISCFVYGYNTNSDIKLIVRKTCYYGYSDYSIEIPDFVCINENFLKESKS